MMWKESFKQFINENNSSLIEKLEPLMANGEDLYDFANQKTKEYPLAKAAVEKLKAGEELTPEMINVFAALIKWMEKLVGGGVLNGAPWFIDARKALTIPDWEPAKWADPNVTGNIENPKNWKLR